MLDGCKRMHGRRSREKEREKERERERERERRSRFARLTPDAFSTRDSARIGCNDHSRIIRVNGSVRPLISLFFLI